MSVKGAALVESVAQALSWAINDPLGHSDFISQNFAANALLRTQENTRQAATVFDSSAIPPITVDKYLQRLCATFRCSDASFVAALIIVDRLLEFDGGRLPLTMRNVHRIFLASLIVSVKYNEDLVYSNSHYAKAGGVHLREINRLERVLLQSLDFKVKVEPEQYQLYEDALHNMNISQEPVNMCAGVSNTPPVAKPFSVPVPDKPSDAGPMKAPMPKDGTDETSSAQEVLVQDASSSGPSSLQKPLAADSPKVSVSTDDTDDAPSEQWLQGQRVSSAGRAQTPVLPHAGTGDPRAGERQKTDSIVCKQKAGKGCTHRREAYARACAKDRGRLAPMCGRPFKGKGKG
eukprot:TRINITY_DN102303_c0_g1_i1.p1 TRINITY_DN102303_c0_g1~~TRINITY_DN102303_c0_g1_i1.p1  ORF type:complete len:347 (-),score=56.78 TRINITY_DN102303_c0_g1_i1:272-1312(-)